jgi:hypothetical protein
MSTSRTLPIPLALSSASGLSQSLIRRPLQQVMIYTDLTARFGTVGYPRLSVNVRVKPLPAS